MVMELSLLTWQCVLVIENLTCNVIVEQKGGKGDYSHRLMASLQNYQRSSGCNLHLKYFTHFLRCCMGLPMGL